MLTVTKCTFFYGPSKVRKTQWAIYFLFMFQCSEQIYIYILIIQTPVLVYTKMNCALN